MPLYNIPTAATIREVEQVLLPRLTANSPIFDAFPIEESDEFYLIWEQRDIYTGLQQVRGLDGRPQRVKKIGAKRYMQEPGVYGEMTTLDEAELTKRRRYGTFGEPVAVTDLVAKAQEYLLTRRINRVEKMLWDLALNGIFSVPDSQTGAILHTDSFTPQTYTSAITWDNHSTATPFADLRTIQLLHRGQSVRFDESATLLVNRRQWNHMISNTNQADLGGRRLAGLLPANNPKAINELLLGEGLPSVVIYDEFYMDETGNYQMFIPDHMGLVIGKRVSGAPVGAFRYTLNVNNPQGSPGPYMRVIDRSMEQVPAEVEVHDGFNGGPVIYFPGAMVTMNI